MTVKALAQAMNINVDHVYDCLIHIKNGDQYSSDNQEIDDFNVIVEVVHLCGGKHRLIPSPFANEKKKLVANVTKFVRTPMPPKEKLKPRPPVVTIMGHVDHGKTSLLDALRNSNIVSSEFGGITQHIGAFIVPVSKSMVVTFIDTPGHLAFAEMRARGAQVTDIVVLVVAADDGVMPQTLESIAHANRAKVPIVVAINKIDKADANIKRTETMLAERGLQLESIGGDIVGVSISALKNINIDKLLESILTVAELQQLRGDPNGPVEGTILESKHEEPTSENTEFNNNQRKGNLATILVQRGVLKKGTILLAGQSVARVRALYNERGIQIERATLSMPVQVTGWKTLPAAGEEVFEIESENLANRIAAQRKADEIAQKMEIDVVAVTQKHEEHLQKYRAELQRRRQLGIVFRKRDKGSGQHIEDKEEKLKYSILIKTDVFGTLEALTKIINMYNDTRCPLDLIDASVGSVNDDDIETAQLFNATIYAFNTSINQTIALEASRKHVPIRTFNVIYHMLNDIKDELTKRIPSTEEDVQTGSADVLQVFEIAERNKKIPVAGCRVTDGSLEKKQLFKLVRNGQVIHRDTLSSLKHLRDDVQSIKKGVECGLSFTNHDIKFQKGDQIICYTVRQVIQEAKWDFGF
ncbi:unnamed protein product [Rotaria sp. Silwood2]|nr:unnamed protein product [Rotaria sp. Silwood2]CAF2509325.1 unnamed protein product [Rotaria sp. Silwood2]CAF2741446.1 unnamed protein product [Rotaria sp. Silwood2]CAF4159393.1 unnamed protein product [Rotaria sp. Silwood2]CAF4159481.1 unnamed protein product [Rotaria sp. Silwood2]